jgi:hypothetical protein
MSAPKMTDEALRRALARDLGSKARQWRRATDAEHRAKMALSMVVAHAVGRLTDREVADLTGVTKGRVHHLREAGAKAPRSGADRKQFAATSIIERVIERSSI